MYKILISDDERGIRERLERFVTKNISEFEVVKTCGDGQEVIDYLNANHVDIVITDIRMIKVSGIEIAKYIYENKLRTKVIILSGYREFEYAQKAIEYNVTDYLVKPTDFDEFVKVLNRLKTELDAEQERDNRYDELVPILKEQFYINILMGALCSREDIDRKLDQMKLVENPEKTMAALFRLKFTDYTDFLENRWDYGKEELNQLISDAIEYEDAYGSIYEIILRNDILILLYVSDKFFDMAAFKEYIYNKLDSIKAALSDATGLKISKEPPRLFDNIYELASVVGIGVQSDPEHSDNDSISQEWICLLVTYIHSGGYEEALGMYEKYMLSLEGEDGESVSRKVCALFEVVYDMIEASVLKINYVKNGKFDYHGVLNLRRFEEIRRYGRSLIFELTKYIEQFNVDSSDMIIRNAKKFINENYHLDISLQDVADHVFLSQKYFSKFFKDKTGVNFVDYLAKVRMDCAIKLLAAGYTIEQISSKIGYRSSRYFTRRFKQYTGFTPKEYARRMLIGEMPD